MLYKLIKDNPSVFEIEGVEDAIASQHVDFVEAHRHSAPRGGYDHGPKIVWRSFTTQRAAEHYYSLVGRYPLACIAITESPELLEFRQLVDLGVPPHKILVFNNDPVEFRYIRLWLEENGFQGTPAFNLDIREAVTTAGKLGLDIVAVSIDATHNDGPPMLDIVKHNYEATLSFPYPVYWGITVSRSQHKGLTVDVREFHVDHKELLYIAGVVQHSGMTWRGKTHDWAIEALGEYCNNPGEGIYMEFCHVLTGRKGLGVEQNSTIKKMVGGKIIDAPFGPRADNRKSSSLKKSPLKLTQARIDAINDAAVERVQLTLQGLESGTLPDAVLKDIRKHGGGAADRCSDRIEEIVTVWSAQQRNKIQHDNKKMLAFLKANDIVPTDRAKTSGGYFAPISRLINILESEQPAKGGHGGRPRKAIWPAFQFA